MCTHHFANRSQCSSISSRATVGGVRGLNPDGVENNNPFAFPVAGVPDNESVDGTGSNQVGGIQQTRSKNIQRAPERGGGCNTSWDMQNEHTRTMIELPNRRSG